MGKQFFKDWKLWQQLTFVLAALIVVTLLLGVCKLQYIRYKLRKYTKVEQKPQTTPEMLEAQAISEEPKEEVPFGIRAIESGIEVDGVWISRSNTPVTSSRSSMTDVKSPRSYSSSMLELPKAGRPSSSRDSSRSAFDRAVTAERKPSGSRSSSPGRDNAARGRPATAPSSRNSNPNFQRNSTTLQALEGLDPVSTSCGDTVKPMQEMSADTCTAQLDRKSVLNSSSNSGNSSARSSDEPDFLALPEGRPFESAYLHSKHTSSGPIDPRTDLDLLQSHRMSHVAETGQLTPRVRRPGVSGDWGAESWRIPQDISTVNGVDYFAPRQKTPSPPLRPVSAPLNDEPGPSTTRFYQSGHSDDKVLPPTPILTTEFAEPKPLPQTYQPKGPQHGDDQEPPYEARVSQSQVLRKVNSGFEILRPGTFGEPPSPEDDQSTSGEKRRSKRLQKRRASSNASRKSYYAEGV